MPAPIGELLDTARTPVNPGFTWSAAGAWATFLALLTLIIRNVGPWRKQTTDAADSLIGHLSQQLEAERQRIDRLERSQMQERRLHFIELRRIEARHEAQRSVDRHKFNNSEGCLDALLGILELSPEKAPEAAKRAREQRAKDRRSEQLEAATVRSAEMAAIERAERELDEQDEAAEAPVAAE